MIQTAEFDLSDDCNTMIFQCIEFLGFHNYYSLEIKNYFFVLNQVFGLFNQHFSLYRSNDHGQLTFAVRYRFHGYGMVSRDHGSCKDCETLVLIQIYAI